MPLPTPHSGESKDDFISRCMGDDVMRDEYPEQDQRAAVCYSQWGEDKQFKSRRSAPTGPMYRFTSTEPVVTDQSRTIRFCFSDDSVDRMGDSIKADGWDYRDFLKNPVALWAHDSSQPPIGRASNLAVESSRRLMGDIEFARANEYPFAETIYQLVKNGYVKAVSVGFIPLEWKWVDSKDRPFGMDFTKQELLEISVVPVPANANALVDARAKGIDTRLVAEWAERILESGDRIVVPRSTLERIRKAALEPKVKRKPSKDAGGDGMAVTDPASGGAVIGNCGRGPDEECGMKDPDECAVHGSHKSVNEIDESEEIEMDEKAIAALVRREVKAATKGLVADIKSLIISSKADDGDGDKPDGDGDDDDTGAEHIVHVKTAHFHAKECMRSLKKALDTTSGDDDDVIAPAESNPEGEKSIEHRRSLVAALRAAAE